MIPVYIAIASLLLGLLSPIWFGAWLPPVRRLRNGAGWIDPQDVEIKPPPSGPLTIKALREYEKCGDRIVVAHHLGDWSRDLQRKIFQNLVANAAISFVLVVGYALYANPRLQESTATFGDFLDTVADLWPLSLIFAATLIEVVIFVKLVSDQAAKYASVIRSAKPKKLPLRDRIAAKFRRAKATEEQRATDDSGLQMAPTN